LDYDAKDAATYIRRGYAFVALKQYEKALNDFTKTIEFNTTFKPYAFNNRANVKRLLKDYEGALKDVNESISIDSLNAFAYSNRGLILLEMNGPQAAQKDLDRAIELNNQVAELYFNRAAYYDVLGQYDKSIADYAKAQDLAPNYKTKEILKLLKAAKRNFLKAN
jgi:tetratricopeptide (TPR) repeat protein